MRRTVKTYITQNVLQIHNKKFLKLCEISGYDSDVKEDLVLLASDTILIHEQLLMFWRNLLPPHSG
jgi:hypothetical protein